MPPRQEPSTPSRERGRAFHQEGETEHMLSVAVPSALSVHMCSERRPWIGELRGNAKLRLGTQGNQVEADKKKNFTKFTDEK